MADLAQRRVRAAIRDGRPDWFSIENAKGRERTATVDIYDEIGVFGTTAKDFVKQLRALDVDQIDLHLNSPGGDVWEGVAILNALRDHPARVVATVDGVAASAASFIAMAGDEVVMGRNTEMMVHDAWGFAMGDAAVMRDLADRMDKVSDNIASVYAERAGGTIEDWRAIMRAETWFSADEAVEAGLADRVAEKADDKALEAKNRFDLAIFNFAGRRAAPAPAIPNISARTQTPAPAAEDSTPPTREGAAGMLDAAKLRESIGLKADASDQEVTAALAAAGFAAKAADPPQPTPTTPPPTTPQTPAPDPEPVSPKATGGKATGDAVLIDPAQLKELQRLAARGDEAFRQLREKECDQVLDDAIKAGKFPPARREHWKALWAEDPDGTKETIDRLRAGTIPVSASGYVGVGDETEQDMLYRQIYPERFAGQGT